jgi:hypothetical protein
MLGNGLTDLVLTLLHVVAALRRSWRTASLPPDPCPCTATVTIVFDRATTLCVGEAPIP